METYWTKDCIDNCNGIRDYVFKGIRICLSNSETTFPKGHHDHEEYEFILVKNKDIITLCNGKNILLNKGTLMPFNSFDIHGQSDAVKVNGFMCITIDPNLLNSISYTAYGFSKKPLFKNIGFLPSTNLNYYLGAFIDESGKEGNKDSYYLSLLVKLIVIELLRSSNNNVIKYECKLAASVLKGKKFLEENYKADFNLEESANAAGVNKFYFIKLFCEEIGLTPKQYFLKNKIEKAKSLISLNQMKLTDIAYELGYSSQAHFSMHFKKHTGITPREFQKSIHL